MEDINIRQATLDDVIGIVYVQASYWIDTYPSAENGILEPDIRSIDFHSKVRDWQHMIQSPNYQVLVAARADKIIGVVAARKDGSESEIYERVILPNSRPQDISDQLVKNALDWLNNNGMIKVRIISYDQASVTLYQRFGFKISELGEVDFIRLPSGKSIPTLEMRRGQATGSTRTDELDAITAVPPQEEPVAEVTTSHHNRLVGRAKLAKLSKVRPSTIKFYTEIGILSFIQQDKRLARRYDLRPALARLKEIQQLRKEGLSIKEISEQLQ